MTGVNAIPMKKDGLLMIDLRIILNKGGIVVGSPKLVLGTDFVDFPRSPSARQYHSHQTLTLFRLKLAASAPMY
jgi:hypothetical protein